MTAMIDPTGKSKIVDRFHPPVRAMQVGSLGYLPSIRTGRACQSSVAQPWPGSESPDHSPRVPILSFTRSRPRSLLSIAGSNSARSRDGAFPVEEEPDFPNLTKNLQRGRPPTLLPAFQAGQPVRRSHTANVPYRFSSGHHWPGKRFRITEGSRAEGGR